MAQLEITREAEGVLDTLMAAFDSPETLPEKLAKTYLNVGDRYCSRWSARNQIIVWVYGHSDAATSSTWERRGRRVRKGEDPFYILKPIMRRFPREEELLDEDGLPTGRTRKVWIKYLAGFEHHGVYGIEQTDVVNEELWADFAPKGTEEAQEWMSTLPWLAVADQWGLDVALVPGVGADGFYEHEKRIGLNAIEMRVWAHEMIHAAEDQLGALTKAPGQQPDNELVAEIGGAILMTLAGYEAEVDLRESWEYVSHYAGDPRKAIYLLLGRISNAVELVLTTAGWPEEKAA